MAKIENYLSSYHIRVELWANIIPKLPMMLRNSFKTMEQEILCLTCGRFIEIDFVDEHSQKCDAWLADTNFKKTHSNDLLISIKNKLTTKIRDSRLRME